MIQFHETNRGAQFFDQHVPAMIKQLELLNANLARISERGIQDEIVLDADACPSCGALQGELHLQKGCRT